MYQDLQKARTTTDTLWNRMAPDDEEDGEEPTTGLFDDDITAAAKKKKKKKKKKKDAGDGVATSAEQQHAVSSESKTSPATPATLSAPLPPAMTLMAPMSTPGPVGGKTRTGEQRPWTSPLHSFRTALIDSWMGALRRSQEEKRIMGGDVLHPAKNLRGRPEVVWKDFADDGDVGEEEDDVGNVPWASWGMRSVKATKWEDLIKEESTSKEKKPPKGKGSTKQATNVVTSTTATTKPKSILAVEKPPVTTAEENKSPIILPTLTPGPVRRSLESAIEQIWSEGAARDLIAQSQLHTGMVVCPEGDGEPSPGKVDRQPKPAGIVWERPTPWSVVQRISKQKLFAIDMDAFDGEGAKS